MANFMNRHNSLFYIILLLFAGSLFVQSCQSKRVLMKKPLKAYGEDYLLEKLAENQMDFDWLAARANISFINDRNKTDFRGQIRMRKDSVIWISFSPALGLEVARMKITQDSIKFMNRIDRVYFEGDYQLLSNFLQTTIDFDMLQSLLIGNDFSFYDNTSFRASIDGGEYRLSTTGRTKLKRYLKQDDTPNIFIQNIWLNPDNFKISRVNLKELGNDTRRLQAVYAGFIEAGDKLFPSKAVYEVQGGNKLSLSIDFSRIETGTVQTFPFRVPERFAKME